MEISPNFMEVHAGCMETWFDSLKVTIKFLQHVQNNGVMVHSSPLSFLWDTVKRKPFKA